MFFEPFDVYIIVVMNVWMPPLYFVFYIMCVFFMYLCMNMCDSLTKVNSKVKSSSQVSLILWYEWKISCRPKKVDNPYNNF